MRVHTLALVWPQALIRSRQLSPALIEFEPAQIFVESRREFSLAWPAFESCIRVLRSAVVVFSTAGSITTSNNQGNWQNSTGKHPLLRR